MERVALQDVLLSFRCRQDDDRDRSQVFVFLDLAQDLPSILPGQVEVEKDNVGAGRPGVLVLASKEGHRLDPVVHDVKVVADLALAQSLARQAHVAGVVLDEQDFHRNANGVRVHDSSAPFDLGMLKEKVVPLPGCDSTQIRPPCRSTMRLHTARPMPVPG